MADGSTRVQNVAEGAFAPRSARLLDRLRAHLRARHYSLRTEQAYLDWARRFNSYHHKRHRQDISP